MINTLFFSHITYFSLLSSFGYSFATALSIISLPLLFLRLVNNKNTYSFVFFSILYLVVFDNDELNLTELKLRPWYLLIMFSLIPACFKFSIKFNKMYFKKENVITLILMSYFFIESISFFIIEDSSSRMYIFKYWFFTVGLLIVLFFLFNYSNLNIVDALEIWYFTVLFATTWGLIQFIGNILGFAHDKLQHDWFNVSPSAFFSERTWYGQYSSLCLVLSFFFYSQSRNLIYILLSIISLFCTVLSFSRSALIPLICAAIVFLFINFYVHGIKQNFLKHLTFTIIISLGIALVLALATDLDFFLPFLEKFDMDDTNIQGRFEALDIFYLNFINDPYSYIFGNGFKWDDSQVSSIGTAVGAKSANLFLMVFYVFGVFGFIISIYIFIKYLLSYIQL